MRENCLFREFANNRAIYAAVLIYITAAWFVPERGHDWDSYCWGLWSERIQKLGFTSVYDEGSPVNYPPLYLYILKIYACLTPPQEVFRNVYQLKYLSLIFDMASLVLIHRMVPPPQIKISKIFILLLMLPVLLYNSLFWNQVDGILSFLVLLAVVFALKRKLFLSVPLLLLALNFKLQAIVFLPVLGLMWLPLLTPKKVLNLLLTAALIQSIFLLPFIIAGNAGNFFRIIAGSVDYFPSVSMNAFNFWHLIFSGNLMWKPDSDILVFGLSIKQAGLLLFFSCVLCMAILLIKKYRRQKGTANMTRPALLSMILICYLFFYFNTQMHERYIHPAVILGAWAFLQGGYTVPWLLTGIAYLFSLDSICHFILPGEFLSYAGLPRLTAIIYTLGLSLSIRAWYNAVKTQKGDM